MSTPRTAWVIPVHNRRAITVECLRRLQADGVLEWSQVYVVDDGSTDGTTESVSREFPSVRLIRGNGRLWWTGAIELGMRMAFADGAELIAWLNDDTEPHTGACARLCATAASTGAVVTGECHIPPHGPLVYGGLRRDRVSLNLVARDTEQPFEVDAACGNFVCFPRAVVAAIGFPDGGRLPHAHGDSDYTLRARAAGFAVLVDPVARADARPNALGNYASWLLSDITVAEIWRPLADKRSYAYAPAHAVFLTRHFGLPGAGYWMWTVVKRLPITVARLVVPRSWLRRFWGGRSKVWQTEKQIRAALENGNRSDPLR